MEDLIKQNNNNLLQVFEKREKQERFALALTSSETLSKLNISVENLPQRCRRLLEETAKYNVSDLDPIAISLQQAKATSEQLAKDYEKLITVQKIRDVDQKIRRNNEFADRLRSDLEESKNSLSEMNPNPSNILEIVRQLRQKVSSYEESYERALKKFSKLSAPEDIYPKSLTTLASQLAALKMEEMELKERADDILYARQCREKLSRLIKS